MQRVYSDITTNITELKKGPTAVINAAQGEPIALLSNNTVTAYIVPAQLYEKILEELDDIALIKEAKNRLSEEYVKVNIDEL